MMGNLRIGPSPKGEWPCPYCQVHPEVVDCICLNKKLSAKELWDYFNSEPKLEFPVDWDLSRLQSDLAEVLGYNKPDRGYAELEELLFKAESNLSEVKAFNPFNPLNPIPPVEVQREQAGYDDWDESWGHTAPPNRPEDYGIDLNVDGPHTTHIRPGTNMIMAKSNRKYKKTEIVVRRPGPLVAPTVTVEEAVDVFRTFQQIKEKILDETDYYEVYTTDRDGGRVKKKARNKSAFRKFATILDLTDEVIEKELEFEQKWVRCPICDGERYLDIPNRFVVLEGNPSHEKCSHCNCLGKVEQRGKLKRAEYTVRVTAPNGRSATGVGACSGTERGFAHPDHDIISTAHTRAKTRAISDLACAGEVSAEEYEAIVEMVV